MNRMSWIDWAVIVAIAMVVVGGIVSLAVLISPN